MENVQLSVSDFVALVNQTLDFAYPSVAILGEVAEYKVSQGKWVTFKLKDDESIVECFIPLFQLRLAIENGMKILVVASPRLNGKWGKFSLTVKQVKLVGEGSIKKGFELLKEKLQAEGLFADERKRALPEIPNQIGVITSTESAAYADFCKILNNRWGGLKVDVAHTQVQGDPAADQIIRAIKYFNELEVVPDVLIIIRGGGSAEDLATFNDELLAREIASSRIPTLVGVGHEVDFTLSDMVADRRASTPSNAAEIIVPDKKAIIDNVNQRLVYCGDVVVRAIEDCATAVTNTLKYMSEKMVARLDLFSSQLAGIKLVIHQLNPENILKQGYALLKGEIAIGKDVKIETFQHLIEAEVKNVRQR